MNEENKDKPEDKPAENTKPTFKDRMMTGLADLAKEQDEPKKDKPITEENKTQDSPQEAKEQPKEGSKEYNLAEMRKNLEQKSKEYEETKARLLEIESKFPKDYDQIKQEHAELAKLVETVALERSPSFQKKYNKPLEESIGSIKESLRNQDKESVDALISWIQSPDSPERTDRLNDAIEQLTGLTKTRVESAIMKYEQVNADRNRELANAGESLKQESERHKEESLKRAKLAEDVLNNVRKEAENEIPFLKKIEGRDSWNKNIDAVHSVVKDYFTGGGKTLEEMAALTYKGVLYDTVTPYIEKLNEELESTKKELESIKNASAKVGGNGGASKGTSKKTFFERVNEGWNK